MKQPKWQIPAFRWADEMTEQAHEYKQRGWSERAIAAKLGVSRETVRRRLDPAYAERQNRYFKDRYRKERGLPLEGAVKRGRKPTVNWTAEMQQFAGECREMGWTRQQIADEMGLPIWVVRDAFYRNQNKN